MLQHVGPQRLLGGEAVAAGVGLAQVAHQVLADQVDQPGLRIKERADGVQRGIHGEALPLQFEVGEGGLRADGQTHRRSLPVKE